MRWFCRGLWQACHNALDVEEWVAEETSRNIKRQLAEMRTEKESST
jgi:hypothetical protein